VQYYGICLSVFKVYAKLDTLKLLISESRTLTLVLRHFAKKLTLSK